MKKLAILLLQVLCIIPAFAQVQDDANTNIKITRQGFGQYRGIVMPVDFENASLRTEGSGYYFDNWNNQGIVFIKDKGKVKIKNVNINLYDNKLEALFDDKKNVFTFDSENVVKIVIDDKVFRTFEMDKELRILELFYQDNISIYKDYNVSYSEASPNPMLSRKSNKYIKREKYYLYDDGQLSLLKMTRKSLSKLLESDDMSHESILEFIKANNLSLKEEDDLIRVFDFVNK